LRSSHSKNSRDNTRARRRAPLGTATVPEESGRERAFLVGLDVRSRRRAGGRNSVTAQAQAARDAASAAPAAGGKAEAKSSAKPSIPEFDAEESLAELRTLAGSAGRRSSARFCSGATGLIRLR